MRVIELYARKGGQGTTTVAAGVAIEAHRGGATTHIQCRDYRDMLSVLGLADSDHVELAGPMQIMHGLTIGDDVPLDVDVLVIDAGQHPGYNDRPVTAPKTRLLVTRNCFLALRRSFTERPDGVVLVFEPGRSLGAIDVGKAIGAPVKVVIDIDPAVARAVDGGLFTSRPPRAFQSRAQALARWSLPELDDVLDAREQDHHAEVADIEEARHARR